MPRSIRLFPLVAALVLATGCLGIADPMPSPESSGGRTDNGGSATGSGGADDSPAAAPDGTDIVASSASSPDDGGAVDVIGVLGLAHAVAGRGLVVVTQPDTNTTTVVRSTDAGTFAALVAASAGARIEVSFERTTNGPASDPVDVSIETAGAGSPSVGGGATQSAAPTASPADSLGQTHVAASGLVAGELASVGNVRTGEVQTVQVPASGSIDVALGAVAGDTVLVILRDGGRTSQVASLTVPAN